MEEMDMELADSWFKTASIFNDKSLKLEFLSQEK